MARPWRLLCGVLVEVRVEVVVIVVVVVVSLSSKSADNGQIVMGFTKMWGLTRKKGEIESIDIF